MGNTLVQLVSGAWPEGRKVCPWLLGRLKKKKNMYITTVKSSSQYSGGGRITEVSLAGVEAFPAKSYTSEISSHPPSNILSRTSFEGLGWT